MYEMFFILCFFFLNYFLCLQFIKCYVLRLTLWVVLNLE